MWVDIPCPTCKGTGEISGIASHDEKGNYYGGTITCFRCNGEQTEAVWIEPTADPDLTCTRCRGNGTEPGTYGAGVCVACFGKGVETFDDGWKEL